MLSKRSLRGLIEEGFNSFFYLKHNQDIKAAELLPLQHYLATGWKENRDPAPWFSTQHYVECHSDALEDGIDPFTHYIAIGRSEGRTIEPSALMSECIADIFCAPEIERLLGVSDNDWIMASITSMMTFFDEDYYLAKYQDVASSNVDAFLHFVIQGGYELRNPNDWFRTQDYVDQHPEILVTGVHPFQHFLRFRKFGELQNDSIEEIDDQNGLINTNPRFVKEILKGEFDEDYYLTVYPDVRRSGEDALDHYISTGHHERRNPTIWFDTKSYLSLNPHVEVTGINPFLHYVIIGRKQGLLPGPSLVQPPAVIQQKQFQLPSPDTFDPVYYLQTYQDVAVSGIDPLMHYASSGWKEGRNPNHLFDTSFYLARYPEAIAQGFTPLQHYIQIGRGEGYLTRNPDPTPSSGTIHQYNRGEIRLPTNSLTTTTTIKSKVAIHLHIFYPELQEMLLEALSRIPFTFELFITTDDIEKVRQIDFYPKLTNCNNKHFIETENRGRNVAPLFVTLGRRLSDFDLCLHVHTKKSPEKGGDAGERWLTSILDALLHNEAYINSVIDLFEREPQCGIIAPEPYGPILRMMEWGGNIDIAKKILAILGIPERLIDSLPMQFPAGMMFWFRPQALSQLLESDLAYSDFPEEPIGEDGTLAHAIERLIYYVAYYNGYYFRTVGLDTGQPLEEHARALLWGEFDEEFYLQSYLRKAPQDVRLRPFTHYLKIGRHSGFSPNSWFDEQWYRCFYQDVSAAIARREILSGFHHYLVSGSAEGRQPRYNMETALETHIPGVTQPVLLSRAKVIHEQLSAIPIRVIKKSRKKIWIVMPRLNPDISFGGYQAFFQFVSSLKSYAMARGFELAVITTEEARANRDYFLWRTHGTSRDAFQDLTVRSRHEIDCLTISSLDRFVVYSTWDAHFATLLAQATNEPRIISFVQEYEPIFHDNSALSVISASGFDVPSYPIFNSTLLKNYFEARRLGIFGKNCDARLGRDYAVFEHVINVLPLQTVEDFAERTDRRVVLYARPEGHAARNLYEIAELALRKLCGSKRFGPEWSFLGIGSLTDIPPVDLGGGHELTFVKKLPVQDYVNLMCSFDIGISLMYAPHPSVVPFEFVTTGALVVTNTYENRTESYFASISPNFVVCEPTIDGVVSAIETALARVDDPVRFKNAYAAPCRSWHETFDDKFLDNSVGRLL